MCGGNLATSSALSCLCFDILSTRDAIAESASFGPVAELVAAALAAAGPGAGAGGGPAAPEAVTFGVDVGGVLVVAATGDVGVGVAVAVGEGGFAPEGAGVAVLAPAAADAWPVPPL